MNVLKKYISIVFTFFSIMMHAQSIQTHTEIPIVQEIVGASPEEMPEYPGGMTALLSFIKTNIQYPKAVLEKAINGTVFLRFTIDTIGNIKDIKLLKGIKDCSECDEEAKRLLSIMPRWKPGKINGKLTNVSLNLPINFRVQ